MSRWECQGKKKLEGGALIPPPPPPSLFDACCSGREAEVGLQAVRQGWERGNWQGGDGGHLHQTLQVRVSRNYWHNFTWRFIVDCRIQFTAVTLIWLDNIFYIIDQIDNGFKHSFVNRALPFFNNNYSLLKLNFLKEIINITFRNVKFSSYTIFWSTGAKFNEYHWSNVDEWKISWCFSDNQKTLEKKDDF